MSTRIWKFLTTDIKGLIAGEAVPLGMDAAEAVLRLAATLQDEGPQSQALGPMVGQITSLLDIFNLPLSKFMALTIPFERVAGDLLQFYRDKTQQEPSLGQCVCLVSQAAYLESIKTILSSPKLRPWLKQVGQDPVSPRVAEGLQDLGQLVLADEDVRLALIDFPSSQLAKAFNPLFATRLTQLGLKEGAAQAIAHRTAQLTEQRMRAPLNNSGERVQRLIEWYRIGGRAALRKYLSIDTYLDEVIQCEQGEGLFADAFTLQDLYVPPQSRALGPDGKPRPGYPILPLHQCVHSWLDDERNPEQILFIEGEAGRGKSTFCRMFADWARIHLHPGWTPVLVQLRDVSPPGDVSHRSRSNGSRSNGSRSNGFEAWLGEAIDRDFTQDDPNWLAAANVRFLFIIDGVDTLGLSQSPGATLEQFLEQVSQFQRGCIGYLEREHRILLTGRTLSLLDRQLKVPDNITRLEILPMDDALRQSWVQQLAKRTGYRPEAFKEFLNHPYLPESIRDLSQEPLFLGLLAAMFYKGELPADAFEVTSEAGAKVKFFTRLMDWVIEESELVTLGLKPEQLRVMLREAGLCSVQLGTETVPLSAIEQRLTHPSLLGRQSLNGGEEDADLAAPFPGTLVIQPSLMPLPIATIQSPRSSQHMAVLTLSHRHFSQFLFAEQLRVGLEEWAKLRPSGTETADVDWEIYDLLGYGGLTPEIVQFLLVMLDQSPSFAPEALFQRLQDFYLRWATGRIIDEEPPTLPQRKMQQLKKQQQYREKPLGQRQVDAYTGFNVMILLLELNRYARVREALKQKIIFYPTGRTTMARSPDRLLRIIQAGQCIGPSAFSDIVGPFLSGVHLSGANLRGTDLRQVNLSGADLSGVNLNGADLRQADLRGADLSGANLNGANLSQANLRRVSLSRAILTGATLIQAFLSNADLIGALFHGADLSGADLSLADLSLADLRGAILNRADLSLADLRSASLNCASLQEAILNRASFSKADLRNAWLHKANLSLADLSSADLSLADLNFANLSLADLNHAKLHQADLRGADLSGADLTQAELQGIRWDETTRLEGVRGLEQAIALPDEFLPGLSEFSSPAQPNPGLTP